MGTTFHLDREKDSLIKESCCRSRPTLLNDLLSHLNKLESNPIQIIWIPSHIDVTGNDRADALAKEALSSDLTQRS